MSGARKSVNLTWVIIAMAVALGMAGIAAGAAWVLRLVLN